MHPGLLGRQIYSNLTRNFVLTWLATKMIWPKAEKHIPVMPLSALGLKLYWLIQHTAASTHPMTSRNEIALANA